MSHYYTIKEVGEALYKEKGSKFIAHAFPITSVDDINRCLHEMKKKYHDARHHCYAWELGMEQKSWRSNDDGEPSHSAGDPILGQIRSFGLTNVLVVVIRYFGGTKLGVGGLIQAYKAAAELSLNSLKRVEIFEMKKVTFEFDYDSISIVERLVADFGIVVASRSFEERCSLEGEIKKEYVSRLNEAITDLFKIDCTLGE